MNNIKKYTVSILGEKYTVVTDESDQHLEKVTKYVSNIMDNIVDKSEIDDAKRIAVLAALQLASKLLSSEMTLDKYRFTNEKLISAIDQVLSSIDTKYNNFK